MLAFVVHTVDQDRRYQTLLAGGDRALASGNAFTAVEDYSEALGLRPDSTAAHLRRGQAYRLQKRDDEAVRDWLEAVRLSDRSTQPLELLGDLYEERGESAQAAAYYEKSVALDARDPVRLYKLALSHYRAGALVQTIRHLRRAVAVNDNFGEAHYLLGLALRDTQAIPEAIASIERAVRVSPTLTAAREELADLYRATNRPVEELAELQALASLDATPSRQVAIAMAEARRGQFDGAVATHVDAAGRAPNDSQVQLALGRAYLLKAERTLDRASVTLALEALERALGGTARRAEGLTLFGRALYLSNDFAGAERLLREAVATSPMLPEAFAYLADTCERQEKYAEAGEALLKLDALRGDTAPRDERSLRMKRLGTFALKTGDIASALSYATRAIDGGERSTAALALLAEAQWKSGMKDEAKATLANAIAVEPRNQELLRLRRVIK